MACEWPVHGLRTGYAWAEHGLCMGLTVDGPGDRRRRTARALHGLCAGSARALRGLCLGYAWAMHGLRMG
eukprot:8112476-Lingulodinium_polyedra.AAC.1